MADASDDMYNMYKECEECGACCALTVIAMSGAELERLTAYVSDHRIEPVDRGPGVCPFRKDDMRCMVYPARPNTCRIHDCRVPQHVNEKLHPEIATSEDLPLVDMRLAFIHGDTRDPRTMPVEWIISRYSG